MAGKISKIYSEALYDAACETGHLSEVTADCKNLCALYESGDVNTFPEHLEKELEGLLSVAIEKGHGDEIQEILSAFLLLCEEKQNIKRATVVTAAALSETKKNEIYQKLLATTQAKDIIIDYQVDESIVGGIKIQVGAKMVDGSVKTKLEKMKRELLSIQLP